MSERAPGALLVVGAEWVGDRPGGLNRYLSDLIHALRVLGEPSRTLLVGPGPSAPPPGLVAIGAISDPLPWRLAGFWWRARQVARSTDVVDVHFSLYGLLPILGSRLRNRPLVVHFQGPWAAESAFNRGEGRLVVAVKRAVERAVLRRASVVVTLSEAFRRLVADEYGVDPDRVSVIPPGVDLDRFSPGDRQHARVSLGVPAQGFVAVCVRRLEPRMGIDVLLRAWASVLIEHPESVLLIAGDGSQRQSLEDLAARHLPAGSFRFLGRVSDDELVEIYRAADCSVAPSVALEGFGLITLESAACGTPAVVSDTGGLPDGVVGLDPTLVVPPGDDRTLARRLASAADGRLPDRDATRAFSLDFSWGAIAGRHMAIYERLRRESGQP
ncbi:MAG: glycosyltransferase family 4 protein [Phycisphaerae bacterium]